GRAQGRKIVVKQIGAGGNPNSVHILFVSNTTAAARRTALVRATRGNPVLIVGETVGFAEAGATINLYITRNPVTRNATVAYELNPAALRRRSLRPSADLTQHGRSVRDR
ncbi:MAG: YfiR family protein, partial [Planctomycetales bacterium]